MRRRCGIVRVALVGLLVLQVAPSSRADPIEEIGRLNREIERTEAQIREVVGPERAEEFLQVRRERAELESYRRRIALLKFTSSDGTQVSLVDLQQQLEIDKRDLERARNQDLIAECEKRVARTEKRIAGIKKAKLDPMIHSSPTLRVEYGIDTYDELVSELEKRVRRHEGLIRAVGSELVERLRKLEEDRRKARSSGQESWYGTFQNTRGVKGSVSLHIRIDESGVVDGVYMGHAIQNGRKDGNVITWIVEPWVTGLRVEHTLTIGADGKTGSGTYSVTCEDPGESYTGTVDWKKG